MGILRQTYYLYLRNLKIWFGQPMAVIPPLFTSIFLFVALGYAFETVTELQGFPAENYRAFLVPMILVQAVVFNGSDAGFAMLTDMLSGYFDKLLLAPINRFSILLGSLLLAGTRALLQGVVIVLVAMALGVSFEGGILAVLLVIILLTVFGMAWACLGLIIALKTKSIQATQASFILFFPFVFLSTAFMPKELLPGWFKVAVTINPVNYVLEGMRALVIEGWEWDTVAIGVGVLLAMTVLLMTGATWLYRRTTA